MGSGTAHAKAPTTTSCGAGCASGLAFLATRFAAKEAVSKAIGLGMRWPMTWRAVQTLNLPSGQPVVRYSGELADWIAQHGLHIQISVTDERDYAVAFAVAELQTKPTE